MMTVATSESLPDIQADGILQQKLATVEIVIDKLHMAGHIDKWCKMTCDPHLFSDLVNVCSLAYIKHINA